MEDGGHRSHAGTRGTVCVLLGAMIAWLPSKAILCYLSDRLLSHTPRPPPTVSPSLICQALLVYVFLNAISPIQILTVKYCFH